VNVVDRSVVTLLFSPHRAALHPLALVTILAATTVDASVLPEADTNHAADPRLDCQIIRYAAEERQPPPTAYPASIRAEEIVGRWGYSSYHREQDRTRAEEQAKSWNCRVPYVVNRSPSGGVMMLGHDSPTMLDMSVKGSVDGKTYIGPAPEPADPDDLEVVSFDGRALTLHYVDPEVADRYGFISPRGDGGRPRPHSPGRSTRESH
jgi:hypothetical protein